MHGSTPNAGLEESFARQDSELRRLAGRSGPELRDDGHLMALAARLMRRILVDHARSRVRIERGDGRRRVELDDSVPARADAPEIADAISLGIALRALAEIDDRQARVVELRYLEERTIASVADELGISTRTVLRELLHGTSWLRRALASPEDPRE